jgi:hypothetical protein
VTDSLSTLVAESLSTQFDRVRRNVHGLVEPLSNEQLWRRPFPYGNSVGHLLLHLTGNLSYYIGAQIAGNGYVRDRRRIRDPSRRPGADVLRDFDRAVDTVLATLAAQREADWGGRLSAASARKVSLDRLTMFVRCAAHADPSRGADDLPLQADHARGEALR